MLKFTAYNEIGLWQKFEKDLLKYVFYERFLFINMRDWFNYEAGAFGLKLD